MLIGALALCAFTVVAFLPELPSLTVVVSGLAAVALLFLVFQRQSWLLVITIFLLFMVRALSWGQEQLDQRLAFEYESVDVVIEGYVDGLPDSGEFQQRFNFRVVRAYLPSGEKAIPFPARIRLSYYWPSRKKIEEEGESVVTKGGDRWRLIVRVKRPHGFANPGGFDYELWLMSRGIGASGYVREWIQPIINDSLPARVHRWRECIRGNFSERLQGSRILGVALALAVGDKSLIRVPGIFPP